NFRPQMAAEATFGFSPAGRSQNSSAFGLVPVLVVPVGSQQGTPIAVRSPVLRDGNVYLYAGTLLTYFNQRGTWRPFFTVGAGGITRTAKIAFVQNNAVRFDPGFIISPISPALVPSTTRTIWPSCLVSDSRNTFRTDWGRGRISAITSTNSIRAQ